MEYKKLTLDEIDVLPIGTKVNFGDGVIKELVEIGESKPRGKTWTPGGMVDWNECDVVMKKEDGQTVKHYASVLQNGTIESLDPSIERCAYCGKLRPYGEMKSATIFVNRGRRTSRYCFDGPCAGYDQMAAEG
jgi:hypothetical protein